MDGSLAVSAPLDVARTLARYRLWGEDPANRLSGNVFRRAVRVDGHWRGYEVSWTGAPDDVRLRVTVPGARSARVVDAALAEARHICGVDLDVASFYRGAAADPVLGGLITRHYGLPADVVAAAVRDAGRCDMRPAGQSGVCLHREGEAGAALWDPGSRERRDRLRVSRAGRDGSRASRRAERHAADDAEGRVHRGFGKARRL